MKYVPKITIKRRCVTEKSIKLEQDILVCEICKESDDDLWRELMLNHLEMLEILNGAEGSRIKEEIRRKLNRGNGNGYRL